MRLGDLAGLFDGVVGMAIGQGGEADQHTNALDAPLGQHGFGQAVDVVASYGGHK